MSLRVTDAEDVWRTRIDDETKAQLVSNEVLQFYIQMKHRNCGLED